MDGQEQILVASRTDHVCRHQESPVEHRGIAEEVGAGELQGDHTENNPFCERLGATEFRHLQLCKDWISIEVASKGRSYPGISARPPHEALPDPWYCGER